MTADLLTKFRELDSAGWESPADFDHESALRSVKRLKPEAESIIRHQLTLDTSPQDASYFAELCWLDAKYYTPGIGGSLVPNIAIRFSAFGRLATVYSGNSDERDLMRHEPRLAQLVTKHGFDYIPESVLREPYPGHELRKGRAWQGRTWTGWTWWTRFFDHL